MMRALREAASAQRKSNPQVSALTADDERYVRLLAEYCLMAKISDPESVLAGEGFTIDNVDFRLIRDWKKYPKLLCVWCDFGPVREEHELTCYRSLLEKNIRYDGPFSSAMALCPETGWVMCSVRARVENLNGAVLGEQICSLAKEALAWQTKNWEYVASDDVHGSVDIDGDMPASLSASDDFIGFLLHYCQQMDLGREAVEQILLGAPLQVAGVTFVLRCGDHPDPAMASLYCDYGALPENGDIKNVYRTLLLANMMLHPATGQAMMVSVRTNHIFLRQDFNSKTMKPSALQKLMENLASKVSQWKDAW